MWTDIIMAKYAAILSRVKDVRSDKMAVTHMKVTELKKELYKLNQDEIIALMVKLYKIKDVKSYLNSAFNADSYIEGLLEESKDKMYKLFNPKGYPRSNVVQQTKKLVTDFCKLTDNKVYILDMKFHYAYYLTEFVDAYGGGPDSAYDNICRMYYDVVNMLNELDDKSLYDKYAESLKAMRNKTSYFGYGVGDEIDDLYRELKWVDESQ